VGIEATLATQWFEKMLTRDGHELWFGDAAEIRAAIVRKQKTDTRDALQILDLLLQDRFPRIWVRSPAERDVRQLVRHRHKRVRFRTSVMNRLQTLALGQGLCLGKKLWTRVGRQKLESLSLDPWASRGRGELLELLDQLDPSIEELDRAVSPCQFSHTPKRIVRARIGFRELLSLGRARHVPFRVHLNSRPGCVLLLQAISSID
jgi:transposase